MSDELAQIENGNGKKKRVIWYRSPKVWRQATMAFFFLFLMKVAYHHIQQGGGPNGSPSIEAYCPFGGLESLYQFATTGGYIRRIEPSAMILFFAVILMTLLFSRGFCSWICPFGSIQEWLGMIGKKIFRKRYNPAGRVDAALRYFKYVVLAVIIALTWWTGTMVFRDYDPFLAFFHLGEGIDEKPWGYGILLVVLFGSFYIERFFCKYACPLGAVLGLLGKVGLTRVQRDPTDCKECNVCQKDCFAHVEFLKTTEITSAECNHCLDCVVDCPKPNVLSVRGPKLRFSHPVYAILMVVGLFGMIGVSKATHTWRTQPGDVELTNKAGALEPEQIRGWMSLQQISDGYGVPMERLYADSGLPERVLATAQIKNIHKEYEIEFEPDSLRQIVRAFLDGGTAPDLAQRRQERPASARKGPGEGRGQGQGKGEGEDHEGNPPMVRGNMTLNEIVLKTGVPKDYIIKTVGLPEDAPPRTALREWIHETGKTPRDIRDAVEQYLAGKR